MGTYCSSAVCCVDCASFPCYYAKTIPCKEYAVACLPTSFTACSTHHSALGFRSFSQRLLQQSLSPPQKEQAQMQLNRINAKIPSQAQLYIHLRTRDISKSHPK